MEKNNSLFHWHNYTALSTVLIAVLAAITSLWTSSTSSLILLEKNNSNYYQAKANKVWNYYLANDITTTILKRPSDQTIQQGFQQQAEGLERQADASTVKASVYFEKNNHFTTAGILFEVAIALSAMAVLVKKRMVWIFSLFLAAVGIYFLLQGLM